MKKQTIVVSIIVPVKNEAENVPVLVRRLKAVFKRLPNYVPEILFVDDGSRDNSAEVINNLAKRDHTIRLIQLARNFGKEIATTAGLHKASGRMALMIDADLQHPPEVIPKLIEQWEAGYDVVIGTRQTHDHATAIKNAASKWFYRFINQISAVEVVPDATDFRLLDRAVIDEFKRLTERNRMTRSLIDWLGFSRAYVPFTPETRLHGSPAYTYRALLKLSLQAIVSLSFFPLRLAGYLGSAIVLFSIILGSFMFVEGALLDDPLGLDITGTAFLAVIILFLVGIVLVCLGLIALYIAAIHGEVMNRPLYIEKRPTSRR